MFGVLVMWVFAVGGLVMAVVCALNILGLARGWLRTAPFGRIDNLALGLVSAAIAGFAWSFPTDDDAPVETWRDYWLLVGAVGLALMVGSQVHSSGQAAGVWRWARHGARIHTVLHEWQPRHVILMTAFTASLLLPSVMPDNWWQVMAWIPFLVLSDSLRNLPVHCGPRPPRAD